jgi:hypothetical protein
MILIIRNTLFILANVMTVPEIRESYNDSQRLYQHFVRKLGECCTKILTDEVSDPAHLQ